MPWSSTPQHPLISRVSCRKTSETHPHLGQTRNNLTHTEKTRERLSACCLLPTRCIPSSRPYLLSLPLKIPTGLCDSTRTEDWWGQIGIKRNNECAYILFSSDVNTDQVCVWASLKRIPPHLHGKSLSYVMYPGIIPTTRAGQDYWWENASPPSGVQKFRIESLQTREAHQMVLPSMGSHSSTASSLPFYFFVQDQMPPVSATQLCAPNHLRQRQYITRLSWLQVCLEKQCPWADSCSLSDSHQDGRSLLRTGISSRWSCVASAAAMWSILIAAPRSFCWCWGSSVLQEERGGTCKTEKVMGF